MLQFDANANAHANVDASVNGPLVSTHVLYDRISVMQGLPEFGMAWHFEF